MGFFDRLKNTFGSKTVRATPEQREEILTVLREHIRGDVRGGFMTEDEIIESCVECYADEYDEASLKKHVPVLARELLSAHQQEQTTWPAVTDCDRLDQALSDLEKNGIVCRQDFSCCGTCGSAEIWTEIEEADAAGGKSRGYLFYHHQDTEGAVEYGTLHFNYGSTEEGEAPSLAVGNEIQAALKNRGFTVNWTGKLEQRIAIELEWKKRRR